MRIEGENNLIFSAELANKTLCLTELQDKEEKNKIINNLY